MSTPKEHRVIAAASLITAIGLVILWAVYYLSPRPPAAPETYQFVFDITSPIPDAVLSILLCLGGWLLLKDSKAGRILSLVNAIYLVYLGIMDVGIPWGNSVFALSIIDITASGALNLWCIVLGLYMILKLKSGKNNSASVPTIFSG